MNCRLTPGPVGRKLGWSRLVPLHLEIMRASKKTAMTAPKMMMLAGLVLLLVLPAILRKAFSLLRGPQKGTIKFVEKQSRVKLKN